jgi:outer membrane lipoprotein-sorting protein
MKKVFSLMLLLATIVIALPSCSDDDDEPDMSYLTEQQKNALSALHGTFSYTLELMNWTTTIEFLEQYHPAKDAFDPSTNSTIPQYIHGKLRITYYEGSSFEYYYRLNSDATKIYMGSNINNWEYVKTQDFRLVNNDQFKLKETKDVLWDTYNRK